jgi:GNAT superfamily N-acetyltransferase
MKEHMENRLRWLEKMMPQGLEIIIALGPRKGKKGLLEYIPIDFAPEPVKGESSLFINCIWILPPFWKTGLARELMQRFLVEAKKYGGATVLAYEGDPISFFGFFDYMPTSFFKRFGFEEVSRDGARVLLHLDLGMHKLPMLLPPKKQMISGEGRMVLDVFCNSQCPWCGWMADKIQRNVRRFTRKYSSVTVNVINTDRRDLIEEHGMSRGICINGEPVIKRMVSWKEVKSALDGYIERNVHD